MRRLALIRQEQRMLALADPHVRVAALERTVAELRWRITALEHAGRDSEPLREHNAERQAEANRLDAEIAKLLDGHPLAAELTAPQVRQQLNADGYTPLPAERTVRLHLAAIRGNGNTQ